MNDEIVMHHFDGAVTSLEAICLAFEQIANAETIDISCEAITVSLEENVYGGRPNAAALVVQGLGNKMYDRVKSGAQKIVDGVGKTARGEYGIIAKAKEFATKLAKFINTVSTAMSKVLNTGYPLMGGVRKKANKLKEMAKSDAFDDRTDKVKIAKASKFLALGNKIATPDEIIRGLDYILKMESDVLTKEKLNKFQGMSEAVLEPYRDSIKRSKVDTIVMAMAVLSTVTNPGAAVGVILKRIFQAANPGLGGKVEKAATAAGGLYGGVGSLVIAMAGGGASTLRQMSNGRLDISAIPKFQPLYPFCNKAIEDKSDLTITRRSETMLGNRYWTVTDYIDELTAEAKGSIAQVGSNFEQEKHEVAEIELPALSKAQIIHICETIDKMMEIAQGYCKEWPNFAKTYNAEYTRITDIVMTHSDDLGDDKKSATAHYVRYSYRNAMSVMLAGMWKNCFGADNQFIRFLVSLSRVLLAYCKQSLYESKEDNEHI